MNKGVRNMFFVLSDFIYKVFKKMYIVIKLIQFKLLYGSKIDVGKRLSFRKGFKVIIVDNAKLQIGDDCFFNHNCSISCLGSIMIGNSCLFGENVKFYDHNHRYNIPNKNIKDQGMKIGSIKVGNNCWIGSNVTILNNVTIGDNVVIGANCLIHKSIPSNNIVRSNSQILLEKIRTNNNEL